VKSERAYLEHIDYCMGRIVEDSSGGRAAFFGSATLQDAILRNLQVLCESTQRLSADLKRANPEVDWKAISGLRNVLVHDYFATDLEAIWLIVERDLPVLKHTVRRLLETEGR
jgi:uncharacterized protein with HEPN domain